jgi:pimeloyl-ACP methyl ester carboxylesterase
MNKFLIGACFLLMASSANAQTCNALSPTINGTGNADIIEGTPGNDIIQAGGGNDTINGNGGDDVICGGAGDDLINGGDGNDQLFGNADNDTINGDADDDVMDGGSGIDACDGVAGIDSAAAECESAANIDVSIIPVTLFAEDSTQLDGALYRPINDAGPGIGIRDVALVVSHGAMGSFSNSVPKLWGLYGATKGFTVLALDRRDHGADGGGGIVLFDDTTLDIGPGVDLLAAIGISKIVPAGHSQGTQNAAIYPLLSGDTRVAAVALFGTVADGRATARDLLFSACPFACYAINVATAEQLILDGFGDDLVAWDTIFGQALYRSPRNFLSFWGPDTLSVVQREITFLEIPALLMLTQGDGFTPAFMSQAVFDAGVAAGIDIDYVTVPAPAGYQFGFFGGNAHGFVATERAMVSETMNFLSTRVPEMHQAATNLRFPELQNDGNYSPVADAGSAISVVATQTATLDGNNSVDVDGTVTTYHWDQIGGDLVILSDTGSSTPSFSAPLLPQTLTFRLNVTDDDGAQGSDTVAVAVTQRPADFNNDGVIDYQDLQDFCACEDDWENHGNFVGCIANTTNEFFAAGIFVSTDIGDVKSTAARASCAK